MFGLGIYHPSGHKFAVHSNVTLWIPNVSHGSHTLHQEPFYSTPPCLVDNPFVATVVSLQRVYIHGVCAVTSSFTLFYSYLPLCDCVFALILAFIQHNPRFPFLFVQLWVHPVVVADGHLFLLSRVTDGGGWMGNADECPRMRSSFSEHCWRRATLRLSLKTLKETLNPKLIKPKIIPKNSKKIA